MDALEPESLEIVCGTRAVAYWDVELLISGSNRWGTLLIRRTSRLRYFLSVSGSYEFGIICILFKKACNSLLERSQSPKSHPKISKILEYLDLTGKEPTSQRTVSYETDP